MYNLTNATFPTTGEGLQALEQGGFMRKIPNDPWGNPYIYRSPGEGGREFDIISYGRDGQPGGEGFNADITNWD
jgi:general secretion pathway protein G